MLSWFFATAAVVLAADLVTKTLAVASLTDEPPVRLLGGAVYLVLVHNRGAAFGLGSGYTVVLALVALIVVGVIIRFARRLGSVPWAAALGLVLGGAGGNLLDRIFREPGLFRGGVVDFVSLFDDSGGIWPVFNVADSALVCGVLLAVFLELTGRRFDGSRMRDSARDDASE